MKKARIEKKLSAKELAAKIGVSEKTLWNWEKGKTTPSESSLKRWKKALEPEDEAVNAALEKMLWGLECLLKHSPENTYLLAHQNDLLQLKALLK